MGNKTIGISYGILAEPLAKQLDKQNFKYNVDEVECFERQKEAINELRMTDILTDSVVGKALAKLHKRIVSHVAKSNKMKVSK